MDVKVSFREVAGNLLANQKTMNSTVISGMSTAFQKKPIRHVMVKLPTVTSITLWLVVSSCSYNCTSDWLKNNKFKQFPWWEGYG